MKYFFDNCISYKFAKMLASLDVDAVSLRDYFDPSIEDTDFLAGLKHASDVYITYDHHQKSRNAEATAIKESGVTALWLGPFWGKMGFWDQAIWLIRRWELIQGFTQGVQPGTCAELKQNGKASIFKI